MNDPTLAQDLIDFQKQSSLLDVVSFVVSVGSELGNSPVSNNKADAAAILAIREAGFEPDSPYSDFVANPHAEEIMTAMGKHCKRLLSN